MPPKRNRRYGVGRRKRLGGGLAYGMGRGRYKGSRKRVSFAGASRRRIKRRRGGRITKRRGTGRRRHSKNNMSLATFRRKMLKADGLRYKLTRNIQSEFQVPLASVDAIQEPKAQYMWPKDVGTTDQTAAFYTPLNWNDVDAIVPAVFGTQWYGTGNTSQVWEIKASLSWQARYQVVNLTNVTVNYEVMMFKCKRDIPNFASTTEGQSFANPLNIAGQYLKQTNDKAGADSGDASNGGLHTERNQLNNIPAWNYWYKQVTKKKFSLAPGKMKTNFIKSKTKPFQLIDWYPQTIVQSAIPIEPPALFCRRKGQTFLLYKMLSAPADVNDSAAPKDAESTRTTPLSLLSYQVNYTLFVPELYQRTKFLPLTTIGYKAGAAQADIRVMGDSLITEIPELVVN